ncbi:hypothetical protein [Sulfuriferula sp. AH1]|uniref:hypothetical protein n=1 Tax=Sulfuriferula sp. AH1 TaxID=1985873 RepID=UPI0012F93A4F|nr:hypothetical protein [Sulfuriferula sp. AH1]
MMQSIAVRQTRARLMAVAVFISFATVSSMSNAASCGKGAGISANAQPRKFSRVADCHNAEQNLEKRPVFDLRNLPPQKKSHWT